MIHLFHKWKILSVRNGEAWQAEYLGGYIDGEFVGATELKERCEKCNKVRARTIKGHWTLEELQPEKGNQTEK